MLKIIYKPKQIKRVADAIDRDENITAAVVDEMLSLGKAKEEKRVIHPGTGRTGLMRVGHYLVNGEGVVLAEPDELKRQTYGLG